MDAATECSKAACDLQVGTDWKGFQRCLNLLSLNFTHISIRGSFFSPIDCFNTNLPAAWISIVQVLKKQNKNIEPLQSCMQINTSNPQWLVLNVMVFCSRGRVALLFHCLHGTLQRPLQWQKLTGGLPQHEPGDELAQHAGALVLLEEAEEDFIMPSTPQVSKRELQLNAITFLLMDRWVARM